MSGFYYEIEENLHILAKTEFLSTLASLYSGAPRQDGWKKEVGTSPILLYITTMTRQIRPTPERL